MAKKDKNFYFDAFSKGLHHADQAIGMVQTYFDAFDPTKLEQQLEQVHSIELAADQHKRTMMEQLAKEFLPPIEREDIVQLGHAIDDIVDSIEKVLRGAYMYDIQTLRPEANQLAAYIAQCCKALVDAGQELSNFRKSALLQDKIAEINRLEEESDRLYMSAMHRLYREETDPIQVMKWTAMFDLLETCCDHCEAAADLMEQIILKNS